MFWSYFNEYLVRFQLLRCLHQLKSRPYQLHQLAAYHSLLHRCHPDSLFPHHTRSFQECSGSSHHTGGCSPPSSYNTRVHPSGPDSEAPHHTPGPAQCTSCHERIETGLLKEITITALAGLSDEAEFRRTLLKRLLIRGLNFWKSHHNRLFTKVSHQLHMWMSNLPHQSHRCSRPLHHRSACDGHIPFDSCRV